MFTTLEDETINCYEHENVQAVNMGISTGTPIADKNEAMPSPAGRVEEVRFKCEVSLKRTVMCTLLYVIFLRY